MKIRMIGCSHHSTPVEIRERFSFTEQQSDAALNHLKDQYADCESVLLSTCNRVELYIGASNDALLPTTEQLVEFVTEFHGLAVESHRDYFLQLDGEQAMEHLFSVASSIDSLIVGESQIASQVHEAYERAVQKGFAGPALHAAFQHANQVAKRVTNETEIHRRRISVPSVAVSEVASEFFERFDDKHIVLIGSGEMGRETLIYLRNAGASQVSIVNRSLSNAQKLAAEFDVQAYPWTDLERQIANADLIVSTTGATEPIVTENSFRRMLDTRSKGTLLILDLAVPRDFEPSIGRLPDVYLYSVDDLQAVCDRNRNLREQQLPRARKIIVEEVERIMSDWQHRASGDTIRALRERATQIREAELSRLLGKQPMQSITPEMQLEISHAFDRLVNKLLHQPLQSIREVAHVEQRDSLVSALRKLFQIR
jgi:glutamyl-tRNA reductase